MQDEGIMWEIALIVAVIVFSITCFFIIRTLISLQNTMLNLKNLSDEATTAIRLVEARLMLFDSIFRSFSNVGEIAETKTAQWKARLIEPSSTLSETNINLGEEIVEWALTSAHLYQQIFKKGGKK